MNILHLISLVVATCIFFGGIIALIQVIKYFKDRKDFDILEEDKTKPMTAMWAGLIGILCLFGIVVFLSGPLGYFGILGSFFRAVQIVLLGMMALLLYVIITRSQAIDKNPDDEDAKTLRSRAAFGFVVLMILFVVFWQITPGPLEALPVTNNSVPMPAATAVQPTSTLTSTNTPTPVPTTAPTKVPTVMPTSTTSPIAMGCNRVSKLGSRVSPLERDGWFGWTCGAFVIFIDDKGAERCRLTPGQLCTILDTRMCNREGIPVFEVDRADKSCDLPKR